MPLSRADVGDDEARRPGRLAGALPSILGTLGVIATGVFFVRGPSIGESPAPRMAVVAMPGGPASPVFSLAWSPDGRRLAACGFGATVRLWDRASGRVRSVEAGTEQPRFLLGWGSEGDRLVLGGLEVPVESWDLREAALSEGRGVVRPTGRAGVVGMIAGAAGGGPIRVRGTLERRVEWLPASGRAAISAAFSTDGGSVVTAEVDRAVRVWDVRTGRLRHEFRGDSRGASCVAFSPDGAKVAAGGGGPLRVWDANSGSPLATLGGESGGAAVIGFAPDGRSIAGAGWDGVIRVWDLGSGLERAILGGHDGQVLALAWSPDGRTIATGGYDSTVRLWDTEGPIAVARAD